MEVSKEILSLKAYVPGKPIEDTKREYGLEEVYKLASNENAFSPSDKVLQAMSEALKTVNRYPDPGFYKLRQKFSKLFSAKTSEITFGNGSNELIDLLIRIYCEAGDKILTLESAFVAYRICAQAARVGTDEVKLNPETLKASVEELLMQWNPRHKIVFIPNPNNPTGTYYGQKDLEKIIHFFGNRDDVLLVFDEAYVEYATAKDYVSALKYRDQYKNLIVLRTLSKAYGLAGLRMGALFADESVVELVDRIRNPFNVNSIAQAAAYAAIDDSEYIKKSVEENKKGLALFYKEFDRIGIRYWESQANFVLFDCGREAAPVVEALLKRGVIVRPVANYNFPNYIRLSVGAEKENQIAIAEIVKVLEK